MNCLQFHCYQINFDAMLEKKEIPKGLPIKSPEKAHVISDLVQSHNDRSILFSSGSPCDSRALRHVINQSSNDVIGMSR